MAVRANGRVEDIEPRLLFSRVDYCTALLRGAIIGALSVAGGSVAFVGVSATVTLLSLIETRAKQRHGAAWGSISVVLASVVAAGTALLLQALSPYRTTLANAGFDQAIEAAWAALAKDRVADMATEWAAMVSAVTISMGVRIWGHTTDRGLMWTTTIIVLALTVVVHRVISPAELRITFVALVMFYTFLLLGAYWVVDSIPACAGRRMPP